MNLIKDKPWRKPLEHPQIPGPGYLSFIYDTFFMPLGPKDLRYKSSVSHITMFINPSAKYSHH